MIDFDAEEIVQLRKNILEFVLQQLHESAARGELRQAGAQLSGPIAAEVEAAVQRALAAPRGAAERKLSENDVSRIAAAVARQLGGRSTGTSQPKVRTERIAESARPFEGGFDQAEDAPRDAGQMQRFGALAAALLIGLAIGYAAAQLAPTSEPALSGTDSATPVIETQAAATSDDDLNRVEGPKPRPAASDGAPASPAVPPANSGTASR